jgi:hypothetical protein
MLGTLAEGTDRELMCLSKMNMSVCGGITSQGHGLKSYFFNDPGNERTMGS